MPGRARNKAARNGSIVSLSLLIDDQDNVSEAANEPGQVLSPPDVDDDDVIVVVE